MKIYFLSSTPCSLTVDGVFYGVTDDFERSAEISLSDNVYAQFSPQGAQPLGFFINDALPTSPPLGCEVYLFKDGLAIYARDFPPLEFTLRPVAQKRDGDLVATVFVQGSTQLCTQSPLGFFNAAIPPSFEPCSIEFTRGLVVLKGENVLGVFTKRCQPLLIEKVLDYEWTEEGLNATLPLSDSLKRTAKCNWTFTENECVLTSFSLQQSASDEAARNNLLAYAFFETVLLKGDFREFLGEELCADADGLLSFLGDFIAVTLTKEPNVCGLVRKKGERLFCVDEVAVEIKDGKIVDVRG